MIATIAETMSADAPSYLKLSAAIAVGLVNWHKQAPAVSNLLLPADEAWLKSAQARNLLCRTAQGIFNNI